MKKLKIEVPKIKKENRRIEAADKKLLDIVRNDWHSVNSGFQKNKWIKPLSL